MMSNKLKAAGYKIFTLLLSALEGCPLRKVWAGSAILPIYKCGEAMPRRLSTSQQNVVRVEIWIQQEEGYTLGQKVGYHQVVLVYDCYLGVFVGILLKPLLVQPDSFVG